MTPAMLKEYTLKDLAQLAKKRGISGWHSMRKEDLVRSIVREEKKRAASTGKASKSAGVRSAAATKPSSTARPAAKPATRSTVAAKQVGTAKVNGSAKSPDAHGNGARGAKAVSGRGAVVGLNGANPVAKKTKSAAKPAVGGKNLVSAKTAANRGAQQHVDGSSRSAGRTKAVNGKAGHEQAGNGKVVVAKVDQAKASGPRPHVGMGTGKVNGARRLDADAKVAPQRLSAVARKIQKAHQADEQRKDLAARQAMVAVPNNVVKAPAREATAPVVPGSSEAGKDRVVLMVRDSYWLHVHWELTRRSILRAQAAMAEYWHTAKPVIRLMEVCSRGTTTSTEMFVKDVEIHGGVNNWYIDVLDPPKGYRVEIGYLGSNGRFHGLARSNSVETPQAGMRDSFDQTWVDVAENCDRIFALSGGYSAEKSSDELQEVLEERLCRPVGNSSVSRFGAAADFAGERDGEFTLDVDAEMIVFGATRPGAHLTMSGEPIRLREDGSFAVRMPLPDRRQVLPITSSSRDGVMQQTIVLAVERNTKVMEAVTRDASE